MTQPTPGPYEIDTDRTIIVRAPGGTAALAQVYSWMGAEEADANARLFRAALEMYDACRAVIEAHESGMTAFAAQVAIHLCRAAIQNVEGR